MREPGEPASQARPPVVFPDDSSVRKAAPCSTTTRRTAPAGAGDVRIRPAEHDAESVEIELSSPSGHATFRATSREVSEFLTRTHEIVAPGSEDDWLDLEH